MHGDAVAALGLAGAGVFDGVFGCYFCGEGEGEEECEEGEDGETHGCLLVFGGQLRLWRYVMSLIGDRKSSSKE